MTRRSKAQWRELIEQQALSGLSAAKFCRQHAINPKYFSLRKRKLDDESRQFVKVTPASFGRAEPGSQSIKLRVIDLDLPQEALLESISLLLGTGRS